MLQELPPPPEMGGGTARGAGPHFKLGLGAGLRVRFPIPEEAGRCAEGSLWAGLRPSGRGWARARRRAQGLWELNAE